MVFEYHSTFVENIDIVIQDKGLDFIFWGHRNMHFRLKETLLNGK